MYSILISERSLLEGVSFLKEMRAMKDFHPNLSGPSGTKMLHFLPLLSILKIYVAIPILLLFFVFLTHMKLCSCLLSVKKCFVVEVSSRVLKQLLIQSSVSGVMFIKKDLWWRTSVNHIWMKLVLLSKIV